MKILSDTPYIYSVLCWLRSNGGYSSLFWRAEEMVDILDITENLTTTVVITGILIINPVTLVTITGSASLRKETLVPLVYSVFLANLVQGLFLGPISVYLSSTVACTYPGFLSGRYSS